MYFIESPPEGGSLLNCRLLTGIWSNHAIDGYRTDTYENPVFHGKNGLEKVRSEKLDLSACRPALNRSFPRPHRYEGLIAMH